ncbi:unnamed protein product [Protopolystoma xenopodis]|uniref:Uncharacterized protein n=1 Tax=Protopolystoma xenopodis TaxID=117903 RepID=A0A3S5CMJ9_9PLAT|nr:unnamed protein product [Protopolystoma xenopodis]
MHVVDSIPQKIGSDALLMEDGAQMAFHMRAAYRFLQTVFASCCIDVFEVGSLRDGSPSRLESEPSLKDTLSPIREICSPEDTASPLSQALPTSRTIPICQDISNSSSTEHSTQTRKSEGLVSADCANKIEDSTKFDTEFVSLRTSQTVEDRSERRKLNSLSTEGGASTFKKRRRVGLAWDPEGMNLYMRLGAVGKAEDLT